MTAAVPDQHPRTGFGALDPAIDRAARDLRFANAAADFGDFTAADAEVEAITDRLGTAMCRHFGAERCAAMARDGSWEPIAQAVIDRAGLGQNRST